MCCVYPLRYSSMHWFELLVNHAKYTIPVYFFFPSSSSFLFKFYFIRIVYRMSFIASCQTLIIKNLHMLDTWNSVVLSITNERSHHNCIENKTKCSNEPLKRNEIREKRTLQYNCNRQLCHIVNCLLCVEYGVDVFGVAALHAA